MIAAVLLALLAMLWWSDAVPRHKCANAGGDWDADAHICRLTVPSPTTTSDMV